MTGMISVNSLSSLNVQPIKDGVKAVPIKDGMKGISFGKRHNDLKEDVFEKSNSNKGDIDKDTEKLEMLKDFTSLIISTLKKDNLALKEENRTLRNENNSLKDKLYD